MSWYKKSKIERAQIKTFAQNKHQIDKWEHVDSSFIESIGFNLEEGILGIKMSSGREYYYSGVPKTIFEDSKKRLWIGEDNGISFIRKGKRVKFYPEKMKSPGSIFKNFSLSEDNFGNIWAISYNGEFFRYAEFLNKFIHTPLPVKLEKITQFFILSNNTFLIGSSTGLFKLKVLPDLSFEDIIRLKVPDGITSGVLIDRHIYWGTEKNGLFVTNIDELEMWDIPLELESVVNRHTIFLDPQSGITTTTFTVSGDELDVKTVSQVGTCHDILQLPVSLGQFTFSVDPNYLLRGFKICKKITFQSQRKRI
jgi:hypothetical protein